MVFARFKKALGAMAQGNSRNSRRQQAQRSNLASGLADGANQSCLSGSRQQAHRGGATDFGFGPARDPASAWGTRQPLHRGGESQALTVGVIFNFEFSIFDWLRPVIGIAYRHTLQSAPNRPRGSSRTQKTWSPVLVDNPCRCWRCGWSDFRYSIFDWIRPVIGIAYRHTLQSAPNRPRGAG